VNTTVGIRHADHAALLHPQKLALTSPTNGRRSVCIVRSRTQATKFSLFLCIYSLSYTFVAIPDNSAVTILSAAKQMYLIDANIFRTTLRLLIRDTV
jgi:hypothetical protein